MRLLTEELREKIAQVILNKQYAEGVAKYFKEECLGIADEILPIIEAEHKETLKAVGSWVEKKRAGRTMADGKMALVKEIPDENWVCFLTDEDVNSLLRGAMPEEVK